MATALDLSTRFERLITRLPDAPGCWLWTGHTDRYGYFEVAGMTQKAHRVSYQLHVGPIPPGQHVLHRCDVPSCVRPDHLCLGTHRDNMREAIHKGRNRYGTGEQARAHRLTADAVREIRRLAQAGVPKATLGRQFQVTAQNVGRIVRGETWPQP